MYIIRLSQQGEERITERWKVLSGCRDFCFLIHKVSPDVLDLFEKQIKEYLNGGELTESYFNEVPRIVCWYEGLIDTEMLQMETAELERL